MDRILEIGDYQIELMDEDLVPVTKSVYDVQDPNQRKSHFTKSIILPSSRVNNQVFSGYFDASMFISSNVQFDPFYNPTKKVKATYYEDSLPVITGYCQLVNINKTKELIEYELIIYGENADFFKTIEGRKLSDLDLSEFDHDYTKSEIIDSWTASSGYVYPQVKNGKQTDYFNFSTNSYVKDYWKVMDYDLWFYVKTLWDKIWLSAGFKYYSDFINTDAFKKLIYKGNSDGMRKTDTEIVDSLISYDLSATSYLTYTPNGTTANTFANNVIIFPNLLQDNLPQYNVTTGIINLNRTANYDLDITLNILFKNTTGSTMPRGTRFIASISLVTSTNQILYFPIQPTLTSTLANNNEVSIAYILKKENYRLLTGVDYKFAYFNGGADIPQVVGRSVFTTNVEIKFVSSRFDLFLNKDYTIAETISVNSLLSSEMTQKDFVMGLVKMFNLYIEPYYFRNNDPNSGGYLTYLIEPRDDYYTSEIIDWTYKIDYNKEFTVKPIGGAKEKFYKFTYDLDKDYYNNLYNQRTGRVFGDVTIDVQNDFLQGTKEVKIPFSLMVVATNSKPEHEQFRPLATDVKDEENKGVRNDKSKPKIMYYNGLITADTWEFGDDETGTNSTSRTTYPSISNFDNINDPDNDLCFRTPQEVYFTNPNGEIKVSNQGLYNKYHKKGLEEVNNKNSKMLECYVNLTPFDVHNLSLRPIYEIDGNHYRLYEMSDYNGKETTKCTFLKLTPIDAVAKSNGTTRGGRGSGAWGVNPDLYHETGNLNDRVKGGDLVLRSNVLTGGGVTYIPPDKDNLVMLQYRTINTSTDLILTGGEGSPLFIIVDTTTGSVDITMPIESLNAGKSYYIVKTSALNNLVIKYSDDTTFETITAATTSEYILTDTDIIKIR
jgi:hypothetical protein